MYQSETFWWKLTNIMKLKVLVWVLDGWLADRLLKAAYLTTHDKQLVKVTVTELTYNAVKSKVIKIFSEKKDKPLSHMNEIKIAQYKSNSEDNQDQGEHYNAHFTHNWNQHHRFPTKTETNPNTTSFQLHPP